MKLLFVFSLPSGGMETLNRQRCLALRNKGVEGHLLYLHEGSGMQNIRPNDIPVWIGNQDGMIRSLLEEQNYDAIVVTYEHRMCERLRQLSYRGTVIYEVQGLGHLESGKYALNQALPSVTAHADAVLYPEAPRLGQLVREYFPHKKKFSFPNCIDTERFRYRKPKKGYSAPVIGWVGRIEYLKNWKYFLGIVHQLIPRIPDLQVWVFDDPTIAPENAEFEAAVQRLGLTRHLVRYPNVPHDQMPDYYSAIGDSGGLLLSTSIMEGFGYAPLEAMLCRCPVAATDSDGVTVFVKQDFTGKIIPHDDVQEAVKQIEELMFDRNLRRKIRFHAEMWIAQYYSLSSYSRHFTGMLTELGVMPPARKRWWQLWR